MFGFMFSFEISIPGLIIFTMLILGSSPKAKSRTGDGRRGMVFTGEYDSNGSANGRILIVFISQKNDYIVI